jgi:hypothetical protein
MKFGMDITPLVTRHIYLSIPISSNTNMAAVRTSEMVATLAPLDSGYAAGVYMGRIL